MTEEEQDLKLLEDACDKLGEYFDSVQVFATRHDSNDDGTVIVNWGSGNWCARRGQVSEWLIKNNERTKEIVRKEDNED